MESEREKCGEGVCGHSHKGTVHPVQCTRYTIERYKTLKEYTRVNQRRTRGKTVSKSVGVETPKVNRLHKNGCADALYRLLAHSQLSRGAVKAMLDLGCVSPRWTFERRR